MTSGYYCAIFPFCGGGKKKKKKRRQKNKGILRLGYHRYPSNYAQTGNFNLFERILLNHLNIKYIVIAYDE